MLPLLATSTSAPSILRKPVLIPWRFWRFTAPDSVSFDPLTPPTGIPRHSLAGMVATSLSSFSTTASYLLVVTARSESLPPRNLFGGAGGSEPRTPALLRLRGCVANCLTSFSMRRSKRIGYAADDAMRLARLSTSYVLYACIYIVPQAVGYTRSYPHTSSAGEGTPNSTVLIESCKYRHFQLT
jgi:hypothetical protein